MQVKHIENYSTLRWNRKTPALIEKQIVSILDHINNLIEQKYDPKVLLEIEKHLSTAHDLYHSRLFAEAIEEYRITQTLIRNLLNSSGFGVSSGIFDSLLIDRYLLFS